MYMDLLFDSFFWKIEHRFLHVEFPGFSLVLAPFFLGFFFGSKHPTYYYNDCSRISDHHGNYV